jgi:hypothetical protein
MMSDLPPIGSDWMHAKTGGLYSVVTYAMIEATLTPAVVYAGGNGYHADGQTWKIWVRPVSEFMDGRFVRLRILDDLPT